MPNPEILKVVFDQTTYMKQFANVQYRNVKASLRPTLHKLHKRLTGTSYECTKERRTVYY